MAKIRLSTVRPTPRGPSEAEVIAVQHASEAEKFPSAKVSGNSDAPADVVESATDRAIHAALGRMAGGFSPMGIAEAWFDWAVHLGVSPGRMQQIMQAAMVERTHIAALMLDSAHGQNVCNACERALPHDRRFRHESWQKWPFSLYAESFLGIERWWDEATRGIHGATQHHLDLLNFVGRQALDTVAPSNFLVTNPEVLGRVLETNGASLVQGTQSFFEDLDRVLRHERPVDASQFTPGKTVAVTPGEVVLRTRIAEVIQYHPTTRQVRAEPILIVPAWIMKYYILDLSPENSLVRHLVDQGFSVFVVSWKNPSSADSDIGFNDYHAEGVLPAIAVALERTGAAKLHGVGYCIGGTLLAVSAAAMARNGDNRLKSLTFLAAQTDFTEAGELKIFVDDSQLAILDDMMWEQGTLEAAQMAGSFHLLRSNDLIWSRLIRHYLLGETETLTDLDAWSADSTRMPRRMHSEYLRSLYLKNDLAEGRFMVDGKSVSLHDITIPIFAVGTEWDFVAPWKSVYKLHRLTGSPVTFALTNGGHNRGIISPPGGKDRHYRLSTAEIAGLHVDPDEWRESAGDHEGSWWPAWFGWLAGHSSAMVDSGAREAAGTEASLGPAPGTYVHE